MRKFEHNSCKETFKIEEASFNEDFSNARIKIIQEGFNTSKRRFYTKEAIEKDMGVFEKKKMYSNHDFDGSDAKRHGARDLRDWIGVINNVESAVDEQGKTAGFANITVHRGWFKDYIKEAKESGVLGELGVSINAFGRGVRKKIDGAYTNVIESLIDAAGTSVDFVTSAGAGGKMLSFAESNNEDERSFPLDKISIDELKESNPELVDALTKEIVEKVTESLAIKDKEKQKAVKPAPEKIEVNTQEAAIANLRNEMDRKDILNNVLNASSLKTETKERIKESILLKPVLNAEGRLDIDGTKSQIAQVIESEESYLKKLIETKVTGNGSDQKEDKTETDNLYKALESSMLNVAGLDEEKGDK